MRRGLKEELEMEIDNLRAEIMDEEMLEVQAEVLANIKARSDGPEDTQDQLRSIDFM